ncbi:restriction endonuclease subunit S [Nitrosomonas sp. Nm34]|uniref:restriction endonuclease subunit S n=1 Tax=Nitrosomonas sp. Nm34 TaxID=1881055 RepID=UPI0008EE2886|nr:restriction endonuclease subunit S [Nitrosomonas sp. Nm34]SFI56160.1 type I restriction enzyme, S subunit [Nitrosomonas sp. Nm34]
MAGNWRHTTLGEFVSLQRGHDLTEIERKPGTIPVMGSAGQNGFHDIALAKGPGIVIGRSGASFGQVHYCPVNYWPHNTALYVTDFHGNDPKFAYYFLKSISFARYNSGSAQPSLNRNFIYPIEVNVPPLEEQHAIAHILGKLDDKIELNRRMSETLEAIARAIFKSWFVDFDPVRAKASGEPSETICHRLGLTPDLLALFPDRLVDSELGEIPEGWFVWAVRDVGNIVCGKTPPTKNPAYYGNDIPFITIPDMHGNVFATMTQRKLSHKGAVSQTKKTLPAGSICVSCIATPGLVVITTEDSQTNQQINSVVPEHLGETYYWFWTLRDLGDEIRAGGSGGSVLTNLSTGRFSEMRVLAATADLRCSYQELLAPLFEVILSNTNQTRTLASLRDTLLPKLLSGELRVPETVGWADEGSPTPASPQN